MADPRTHVQLVEQVAPPPWSGAYGGAFIGIVCGLMNDMLSEGAAAAVSAQWLVPYGPGSIATHPEGGLDFIGQASGLPRYAAETTAAYRARLLDRWTLWAQSAKDTLISELEAAGFAGISIEVPNDFDPRPDPTDYWSRFWIRFPQGSTSVTGPNGFAVGTGVVGTDRIGPDGFDSAAGQLEFNLICSIVRRMKPSQWVVWDYIFETTGGEIRLQGKRRLQDEDYVYSS